MFDNKRVIIWSIIGTGLSSIAVQLVTIREFLTQFHGNEIIISLVLFIWLFLTGIGSLAAKCIKPASILIYPLLILLISILPLGQIIVIRYFRDVIFIHGTSPGFYQIFFFILIITTPYCFLIGFILPFSMYLLNAKHENISSGDLYILDNIGDILGGVLFSFLLVYLLKPFKAIALTSSFLILTALLLLFLSRRYYFLIGSAVLISIFYFYAMNEHFELSLLSKQYGKIERYIESPFGRIVISRDGSQFTFWESGLPIYSDADVTDNEEKIHYPLCQRPSVGNILLISGGLGGALDEILKYGPEHVDYVELDPYLTGVAMEMEIIRSLPDLDIVNTDARFFLKKTFKKYDAIIIDLPEPDTFQVNRFFTSEFYSLVKKVLNKEGILSFGMSYYPNYISEIRIRKLSTVYNTAALFFENILVLPGSKAYFLCSDGELSTDILSRLKEQSILTRYIEGFYSGNVTEERIRLLQNNIDRNEYINTDFEPRMMNIVFKEWFFKHGTSPKAFYPVLLVLVSIYLIFMKKEEFLLFSTGMATMGVEILIVFTFQVIYGYIYLKIGAIVTVFLIGLLPGAVLGNLIKTRSQQELILSDILILGLLMLFFIWSAFFRGEPHQYIFLGYGFVFSFFSGFQFPLAATLIGEKTSPVAGCLAADLTGAALGTIIVGILLVPLSGIKTAIVFLVFVKITSSMILLFTGKKES